MTSSCAFAPEIRLMVDKGLLERLIRFDDARYAMFQEAMSFAQAAIAQRLAKASELPTFLVTYADLEMVVAFCRVRERFIVRAIAELNNDVPPPSASAPLSMASSAENILHALGVDPLRLSSFGDDADLDSDSHQLLSSVASAIRTETGQFASEASGDSMHDRLRTFGPVVRIIALARDVTTKASPKSDRIGGPSAHARGAGLSPGTVDAAPSGDLGVSAAGVPTDP